MSQRIVLDEKTIREEFIRHNTELADKAIKFVKKELQVKRKRKEELSRLMQVAYEDRVKIFALALSKSIPKSRKGWKPKLRNRKRG